MTQETNVREPKAAGQARPKIKLRPDTGDAVVDAVLGTGNRIREGINVELAACGLSLWTFKALRKLDALGPSRSVDLGDALCIAARTVTGAVDALEAEGLVERQPHPADRRAHLLVLTPAGRERLATARAIHQRYIARARTALTEEQRDTLLGLVNQLDAAFQDVVAD